jgi:hypothetical protein
MRGSKGCGRTLPCCHPEPFAVILSEAKDLALCVFMNIRDSSSPAAQNDSANEFFRSLSSRTTLHRRGRNPSVPQIPD